MNTFTRLHTEYFSWALLFPLRYSHILHTRHLNPQLPPCQQVEAPLKLLRAENEEIRFNLDMVIITARWLLVACSIPFVLFL